MYIFLVLREVTYRKESAGVVRDLDKKPSVFTRNKPVGAIRARSRFPFLRHTMPATPRMIDVVTPIVLKGRQIDDAEVES